MNNCLRKILGFKRKKVACIMIVSCLFLTGCNTNLTPNVQAGQNNQQDSHNTTRNISKTTNGLNSKDINILIDKSIEIATKPLIAKEKQQDVSIHFLKEESITQAIEIKSLEHNITTVKKLEISEKKLLNSTKIEDKKKINLIKKANIDIIKYLEK